jgi:hypothetical protein
MEQINLKNKILCNVLNNTLSPIQEKEKAREELIFYINTYYEKEIININNLIEKINNSRDNKSKICIEREITLINKQITKLLDNYMIKIKQTSSGTKEQKTRNKIEHDSEKKKLDNKFKELNLKKKEFEIDISEKLIDIHLYALKLNIDDDNLDNIVIKAQKLIAEIQQKIPKIIKKECELMDAHYNKVNNLKFNLKENIKTNIDNISLSENDIKVMGSQTDPIVFMAHGALTGTQFYINSDKLILYTMIQPGTIFHASQGNIRTNFIIKTKEIMDKPYDEIIIAIEDILRKISLTSNIRDVLFDVKEREKEHLLKKHIKKSEKKYLMNEMILSFTDTRLNTNAYNLFHEARTTTETTLIDEHWDDEQYDSTLYKPPKFLAFNAEKTQYLLSDLINFYGERPYILFNCRSMRLASYDINYLSPILQYQDKLYIQPLLTRLTSNIDNLKYREDTNVEEHTFYLKYLKYKNKYKKLCSKSKNIIS